MTNFTKGTNAEKVYNILLTHEFMKKAKIEEKTGIPPTTLSQVLTNLRRKGLVSYSGNLGNLAYKKHPIDKPLYPPQEDIIKRKNSKIDKQAIQPNNDQVINHLQKLVADLGKHVALLSIAKDEYVEYGVINGETVYKKR